MQKFILLLVIGLLIMSCKKNITDTNNNSVIMPLAIGNSWTFEQNIDNQQIEQFTVSIVSTYDKDGFEWYSIDALLLRNDSEGLWLYADSNSNYLGHCLWAKYPAKTGDKFREVWVNGEVFGFSTCTATNATFEQYDNCYVYKHTNTERINDYFIDYFKPNIGWVGYEEVSGDGSLFIKRVLISYNIE